jgi:hypothetical protein
MYNTKSMNWPDFRLYRSIMNFLTPAGFRRPMNEETFLPFLNPTTVGSEVI